MKLVATVSLITKLTNCISDTSKVGYYFFQPFENIICFFGNSLGRVYQKKAVSQLLAKFGLSVQKLLLFKSANLIGSGSAHFLSMSGHFTN